MSGDMPKEYNVELFAQGNSRGSDVPPPPPLSVDADSEDNADHAEKQPNFLSKFLTKKRLPVIGVATAVVALGATYLGGVVHYSDIFFPHTSFGSADISALSVEEAQKRIAQGAEDSYSLAVTGEDMNFTLSGAEAHMEINVASILKNAQDAQSPWSWPVEVFREHPLRSQTSVSFDEDVLKPLISSHVENANSGKRKSVNASVSFDHKTGEFIIEKEVQGTVLSVDKVTNKVLECLRHVEAECVITADDRESTTLTSDSDMLISAKEEANSFISSKLTLKASDITDGTTPLDSKTIASWITFNEDWKVDIDAKKMEEWVSAAVKPLQRVGAQYNYTRPDGKSVSVSGGDFGCSVNKDKAIAAVKKAVEEKKQGELELESSCSKNYIKDALVPWKKFVDVDLTEQHARFYDENNNIIWEAGIVTGNVKEKHDTPVGVYSVKNKIKDKTLRGRIINGEPEYESYVRYWMPFNSTVIGFHDADWRRESEFSRPSVHLTNGSHGCVNLSISSAKALWDIIQVGDVVVVHN